MALKATSVQFSGVMPGGHASASFEVAVENAYMIPPIALREGTWIVLRDDAHELFEGEVLSVKPVVDADGHKLAVECGGMLTVAGKRQDVVQTWVHRGSDGWIRRPGTPESGSFSVDNGVIYLLVPTGATEDFSAAGLSSALEVTYVLDDELSDEEISYVSYDVNWDVTAESGVNWMWRVVTASSLNGAGTTFDSQTGTSSAGVAGYGAPPSGTKVLRILLWCASWAHTVAADRYVQFSRFDIYSSGRTTKPRIDEAMVDLATRPGIATSYTSAAVGPQVDDLSVGSGIARTSAAEGLQTLADLHAQPFDWAFWDDRHFYVGPRATTPENDARVIVVGGGRPGLVSWDVAEYDEDVPDYACVIFGNKDSAAYPEGWPRRIYRPSTPPDDNVKLETLDHSATILSDAAAEAIGDNLVGRAAAEIPPDYCFRVHPHVAKDGKWPGNNDDPTTDYQDISDGRAVGTLANAPQWGGTNSPADPSCLTFNGSTQYVDFGDLAALDLGAGARSASAWVKVATIGATQDLLSKRSGTGDLTGWECRIESTGRALAVLCENSGTGKYYAGTGGTVLSADTWYHLVFSYSGTGGSWSIYVNGVAETMTPAGTAGAWDGDVAEPMHLGVRPGGGLWLDGSLGDVTVYPRALSAAEAAQLYAAGQVLYDRSLAKGNAVLEGYVENRLGARIRAAHVRAGWWIQNTETGSRKPLYITGHSVSLPSGTNALTIGADAMEEAIGVRAAEMLAIPETVIDDTDEYPDEYEE